MKILVALSRFPYPTDKGDKLRAYFQIRDLCKNHEIYLVCLTEEEIDEKGMAEMQKYCKRVDVIKLSAWNKLFNLLLGLFNRKPFQVNYFRSSKMRRVINNVIDENNVDVCYAQLIRIAENIPFRLGAKYFLDYMDSFSEGMKKRQKLSSWYEKPLIKIEANRLRKYEHTIASKFDAYSIITEADTVTYDEPLRSGLLVIPNGVGNHFLNYSNSTGIRKKYDLIFTGNMGYHPNVKAAKYIVENILPALKKKNVNVSVCLAGTNPSDEVRTLQSEDIEVTGFVEDIRPYLAASKVFVAPLFSGSGLQNKLLEAMSIGLPVVTSPLANSALKAQDGLEIMVASDADEMTEKILFLLEHPQPIAANGKKYVEANFRWETHNLKLETALVKLCSV